MTNVVEKFVGTAHHRSPTRRASIPRPSSGRNWPNSPNSSAGTTSPTSSPPTGAATSSGNEQLRADAVRWLRGEFATRTDARTALGVRSIVDDSQFYDQLKLMACFARLAGFGGLLVCLDEMVNLYKLANAQARNANYEQILRILNDTPAGQRRTPRLPVRRHPGLPPRPTPRPVFLSGAAVARLAENTLRHRRARRLLRAASCGSRASARRTSTNCSRTSGTSRPPATRTPYLLPDDALVAFMRHCSAPHRRRLLPNAPSTTIKRLPGSAGRPGTEPAGLAATARHLDVDIDQDPAVDVASNADASDPTTLLDAGSPRATRGRRR